MPNYVIKKIKKTNENENKKIYPIRESWNIENKVANIRKIREKSIVSGVNVESNFVPHTNIDTNGNFPPYISNFTPTEQFSRNAVFKFEKQNKSTKIVNLNFKTMKNLLQIFVTYLLVGFASVIFWSCDKKDVIEQQPLNVANSEVTKIIQDYFDKKNQLLVNGLTQQDENNYLGMFSNNKNARTNLTESQNLNKIYQESNIVVKDIKTQISIDSLQKIDSQKYVAIVSLIKETFTDAKDVETGEPITTKEANVYKLTLINQNDKWLINNDESLNSIGNETHKNTLLKESNNTISTNNNARVESTTYSRTKAVKYATDNALSYNTCGYWFYLNGGDCTDFVSSCLSAGGWTGDGIWWLNYCGPKGASYAWGGASNFRDYLLSSNRVNRYTPTVWQLGDVISFSLHNKGFDHNTIVTKIDTKGNVYLSYHTSNTLNMLYSSFIATAISQNKIVPVVNPFSLKDSF